jgi:uncharacterized protein YkwD
MTLSRNSSSSALSLSRSFGWLALSSLALLACGQPQSEEVAPEGFPEPIATDPKGGEFTAQAVDPTVLARFRAELLVAVNKARSVARTCGTTNYPAVPALTEASKLDTSAQAHATDMVTKNFFSHTGSDGSQPWDRMTRAGYKWSAAGENIAAGNSTVAATMDQWLKSPGHCANIMGKNFTQIGFGYNYSPAATYKYYWVQNFAKPL